MGKRNGRRNGRKNRHKSSGSVKIPRKPKLAEVAGIVSCCFDVEPIVYTTADCTEVRGRSVDGHDPRSALTQYLREQAGPGGSVQAIVRQYGSGGVVEVARGAYVRFESKEHPSTCYADKRRLEKLASMPQ